jgi:hypothetical protein
MLLIKIQNTYLYDNILPIFKKALKYSETYKNKGSSPIFEKIILTP